MDLTSVKLLHLLASLVFIISQSCLCVVVGTVKNEGKSEEVMKVMNDVEGDTGKVSGEMDIVVALELCGSENNYWFESDCEKLLFLDEVSTALEGLPVDTTRKGLIDFSYRTQVHFNFTDKVTADQNMKEQICTNSLEKSGVRNFSAAMQAAYGLFRNATTRAEARKVIVVCIYGNFLCSNSGGVQDPEQDKPDGATIYALGFNTDNTTALVEIAQGNPDRVFVPNISGNVKEQLLKFFARIHSNSNTEVVPLKLGQVHDGKLKNKERRLYKYPRGSRNFTISFETTQGRVKAYYSYQTDRQQWIELTNGTNSTLNPNLTSKQSSAGTIGPGKSNNESPAQDSYHVGGEPQPRPGRKNNESYLYISVVGLLNLNTFQIHVHEVDETAAEDKPNTTMPTTHPETTTTSYGITTHIPPERSHNDGGSTATFPTTSTTKIFTESAPRGDNEKIYMIIVGILALIIFLAMATIIFVLWRKYKASIATVRCLSKEEVEDFYHGDMSQEADENDLEQIDGLAFKKHMIIPRDQLRTENVIIGKGQYGIVYLGEFRNQQVAIKCCKPTADVDCFRAFLKEVKVMAYVGDHENVTRFIGAVLNGIEKGQCMAVIELSTLGNLYNYLRKHSKRYSDITISGANPRSRISMFGNRKEDGLQIVLNKQILVSFCKQIAAGMEYLSGRNVIHGDLAIRNILVFGQNVVKITDFGLSRKLYSYTNYTMNTQAPLPWRWMALESLRFMHFSTKSDVWAFGVVMWEIFSLGQVPYFGVNWTTDFADCIESGQRLTKPPLTPHVLYNWMRTCWDNNPDKRPTFTECTRFLACIRPETIREQVTSF